MSDTDTTKTVGVILKTGLTHKGKKHVIGETVQVAEDLAKRLVKNKQAVRVEADRARQTRKATAATKAAAAKKQAD